MKRYRKKSTVMVAIQFSGKNYDECKKFLDGNYDDTLNYPNVKTLSGVVTVAKSDWILKRINWDFYHCKNDIFLKTYEQVEEDIN